MPAGKMKSSAVSRIPLYLAGVVVLCLGIVLCVKSGMGVSPINSIPYVGTFLVPYSLGMLSVVFYLVNIAMELLLSKRERYVGILLQLPVSLLFGVGIDAWNAVIPSVSSLLLRSLCLCGSLFFTAFGIMLVVAAHLVPDPPTGAVQTLTRFSGKNMGTVKVLYDCTCVVISLLLGFCGAGRLIGFGVATIASAVCVGRILALLQNTIGKQLRRRFPVE